MLGQMLDQHAARPPMGPVIALAGELGHRQTHLRRDLFGLHEIGMRDLFERIALERHDALIALGVGPWSMVMARCPLPSSSPGVVRPSSAALTSAS